MSPETAVDYHGSWNGPGVELTLTPGRTLSSGRFISTGIASTARYRTKSSLQQCEWKGLAGRDVVIECGDSAAERIRVDLAPHREGAVWKMTVEEVELTRR